MRLSEAIRLGSMLKPQGFGTERSKETACVLDAAALAIGADVTKSYRDSLKKMCDLDQLATCPSEVHIKSMYGEGGVTYECSKPWPLIDVIIHLNDEHRWTREQIADWVDTVIPPQAVAFLGGQDDENTDQSNRPVPAEPADAADAAARDQFAHAPSSR